MVVMTLGCFSVRAEFLPGTVKPLELDDIFLWLCISILSVIQCKNPVCT